MRDRDALDAVREAAQWFPGRSDGVAERPSDIFLHCFISSVMPAWY
jgi:hypothetical protein